MVNSTAGAIGGMGVFFGYGTQLGLTNTTQLQQTIPVGTTFTYSFWAKCDSGNSIGFSAGAVCESQTHVSNTGFGNLTTSWRRHTVTFKQTRTDKKIAFKCDTKVVLPQPDLPTSATTSPLLISNDKSFK